MFWFIGAVVIGLGGLAYLILPKRTLAVLEGAEYKPETEEIDPSVEAAIEQRPPLFKVALTLRWLIAAGVVFVGVASTGWWGAGIMAAGIVLYIPLMIADTQRNQQSIEDASTVAAWADQIRALVMAGVDRHVALGQAALNQDHPAMQRFAAEIDVHTPELALTRLAQRIQHPQADLIVGILVATEGETVGDMTGTLHRMSTHIRSEVGLIESVLAKRAGIRMERNLTALIGFGVMGLIATLGGLAAYYDDFLGQVVIVGVTAFFAAGMWWMARLEKFKTPARFRLRGTKTL